ncbi:HNH endonuclease [Paludisphaera rhizosphaerae]|uniref:HNH endonuclease n=1 Tax=Paludisphaera rhizosphaerae TaxID=2711216 RepID=UPI0013EC80DE|nr:HNH endonuclease [Paludisphaera rhizosphaerae]
MDRIPARPDRLPWQRRLERKPPRDRAKTERHRWLQRAAWIRCRDYKLSLDPLCEDCKEAGELVPAQQVHHLISREVDPAKAYDRDNLRSLCLAHHRIRETALQAERGGRS